MISEWEVAQRLLVALLLSSLVGLERERGERAAGLRTHSMVGLGACLVMVTSAFGFADTRGNAVSLDPSRMAAQVVSGIGFLGAGAIIFQREVVRGLTTASSIWVVAAIGLAVGGGLYMAGVLTTALTLVILAGLKPIEQRLFAHARDRRLGLVIDRDEAPLSTILTTIRDAGLEVHLVRLRGSDHDGHEQVELLYSGQPSEQVMGRLAEHLNHLPGVRGISYALSRRNGPRTRSQDGTNDGGDT